MMKFLQVLAAMLLLTTVAFAADEFDLTVDGQIVSIITGQELPVKLKDGREIILRLDRKKTLTFEQATFSFTHPGDLKVASKQIENGLTQHILITATGTTFLVQTYDNIDPSFLIKLMTSEITDEDVAAGATRDTQPHTAKLSNGVELLGERSILKKGSDDIEVDIVARRVGSGGVLVITRYDRITSPEDKPILDQFWSTLTVKSE